MTELTQVLGTEVIGFSLEACRIVGVVMVAPLQWAKAPTQVKAGLVIALAVIAHGVSPVDPKLLDSTLLLALAVLSEVGIGAAMGFVVRLLLSMIELAGDSVGPGIGYGSAQMFDPQVHAGDSVLTSLLRYGALLVVLAAGLHRELIAALLASFRVLPPGSIANPAQVSQTMLELSARAIEGGARMALPILGVLLMVQLSLAFISRAAPAMQIFSIGFSVTLGAGLLTLSIAWPDMARELLVQMSHLDRQLEQVLLELGARPP